MCWGWCCAFHAGSSGGDPYNSQIFIRKCVCSVCRYVGAKESNRWHDSSITICAYGIHRGRFEVCLLDIDCETLATDHYSHKATDAMEAIPFHLHPIQSTRDNAHSRNLQRLTSVTLFRRHLDGNINSSLSRQKTKATLTRESQINVVVVAVEFCCRSVGRSSSSSSSSRFGKTKRSLAANAHNLRESVVVRLVLGLERLALARVNRDPVTDQLGRQTSRMRNGWILF